MKCVRRGHGLSPAPAGEDGKPERRPARTRRASARGPARRCGRSRPKGPPGRARRRRVCPGVQLEQRRPVPAGQGGPRSEAFRGGERLPGAPLLSWAAGLFLLPRPCCASNNQTQNQSPHHSLEYGSSSHLERKRTYWKRGKLSLPAEKMIGGLKTWVFGVSLLLLCLLFLFSPRSEAVFSRSADE